MSARAALQTIQIFNPYVNQGGSFNAYSYYDHGVETQENFRDVFPVTDQCERSAQLMGDDYVRLKFNLTAYVPMAAFSFIRYDGQTFFLMNDYCPHSKGSVLNTDTNEVMSDAYEYDVKFYSVANMLRKPICYRHVKVPKENSQSEYYEWDEPEISVSATLETMYVLIVGSIAQYVSRLQAAGAATANYLFPRMLQTLVDNGLGSPMSWLPAAGVKLTAGTELSTFSFNGDYIADVCTAVANQFSDEKKETEWYIVEDANHSLTLHFCKCEDDSDVTIATDFSQKNRNSDKHLRPIITGGLSKVEYSRDTSNIPQVIVPYGAERNMTYAAVKGIDEISHMQSTFGKRVRLKPETDYDVWRYAADGVTKIYTQITTDIHGGILNDQVTTGVEKVEFFEDVYPQCHFQITKVDERIKRQDGSNVPEYTCEGDVVSESGVPFVESDFFPIQIEEGTTLSVRFESGFLNGREFEIANKSSKKNAQTGEMDTHYTLRFTIVADGSIEDGTLIPSGNFKPMVGDKFALFNMKMPEAYITYAQGELAQKAYEKLLEYQETVPDVKCTTNPRDFAGKAVAFGKKYKINSEKIGFTTREVEIDGETRMVRVPVDFLSRITAYSYKLTKPDDIQFTLSSALVRGVLSEMASAITSVTNAAGGLGQRSINLSRRGWRDAGEIADMLDSIRSEMMLIGNEKYQFGYTMSIEPHDASHRTNEEQGSGAFDHLHIGYGTIQHTQHPYVDDYPNAGLWEVSGGQEISTDANGDALVAETPYFVYADCQNHAVGATATIGLYADKQAGDDYMLLGILSSEYEHQRVFSPTNGFTAIEGGTITTEQIQDANRQLIIDFLSKPPRIIARGGAEIIGNITFKSFKDANGNEVTVGSRNLLRGTDWFDTDHYTGGVLGINDTLWSSARWRAASTTTGRETTVHTFSSGKPIPSISTYVKIKLTAAQSGWVDIAQDSVSPVKKGKTYMLSVYAKATTAAAAKIHLGAWTNSTGTVHSKADVSQDLTSSWKRYTFMFMWEWDEVPNIYFGLVGGAENDTLELCGMQLEESAFVSDWRPANEDTDSAIAEAQENASDALKKANSIADDGIISGGTEKATIKKEWQEIAGDNMTGGTTNPKTGSYYKAKKQASDYGISSGTTINNINNAYAALETVMKTIIGYSNGAWDNSNMQYDTYLSGTTPPSGASTLDKTRDQFAALWRTYYDAEIALLNAVSEVIDTREIGGENLLYVNSLSKTYEPTTPHSEYKEEITYYYMNNNTRVHTYLPKGKYVFSCDMDEVEVGYGTLDESEIYVAAIDRNGNVNKSVGISWDESHNIQIETTTDCYFILGHVFDFDEFNTGAYCIVNIENMQLQKGTRSTAFSNYMEHLTNAMKGTTEINGGLLMTNVMMLKDEYGNITAGMSGLRGTVLNPENVLLWGGATYAEALNAALHDYFKSGTSGELIQTLIKKDGTGKIGCFRIVDNDTISVDNGGMRVYITLKSIRELTGIGDLIQGNVSQSYSTSTGEGTLEDVDIEIPLAADSFFSIENFEVSVYGMPATSQEPIAGNARVKVKVTLGGTVLTDEYGQSMDETVSAVGSGDGRNYGKIEGSTSTAKTLRIQCYDINAFRGSYSLSFSYKAGAESDFRCCVIAKDGLMVASGHNRQFYVKPDLDNLHFLCHLPSYSTNLENGELYVDAAGFVRQKIEEDDYTDMTFVLGTAGSSRARLDLRGFKSVWLPS